MRALAWDDRPEEYLPDLTASLVRYGIHLEVTGNEADFITKFEHEPFDFVITDLVDERRSPQDVDVRVGSQIAIRAAGRVPVFMLTSRPDRFDATQMGIPPSVILKSKFTLAGWMAADIVADLRRLGVYVARNRVFLIYGHDRNTRGLTQKVRSFLQHHLPPGGLVEVSGVNLVTSITEGLAQKMHGCGGIVAVCTPDDRLADIDPITGSQSEYFQPRQNVLLEIGLALGLPQGLPRLTILQNWGQNVQDQARLPSDLAGIITLRYSGDDVALFRDFTNRLIEQRIELTNRA